MPNESEIEAMSDQNEENTEPLAESDATVTLPKAEVEALRAQIQELKERMLRSQAEFENVKKRLRKEADDAGTRAIIRFVKPVLTELDNFSRAVNAASPDAFAEFANGVAMIGENLNKVLTGAGIEPVPSEGVFDPAYHEVIAEIEKADVPRGTIVEVHRPGYRLKDQLVRAAQVIVSRPPAE